MRNVKLEKNSLRYEFRCIAIKVHVFANSFEFEIGENENKY